jgi:protein SCO1
MRIRRSHLQVKRIKMQSHVRTGFLSVLFGTLSICAGANRAWSQPAAADHCEQHAPLPSTEPLPGASLYHLDAKLTDQEGAVIELKSLRGQPVLIGMFYASCTSVCPLLIGHLQRVEASLPAALRAKVRVVLVSLDPERDSVARLMELAKQHGVDRKRWHFTRTTEASLQEIAAVLGVRYRRMENGDISHSPTLALLDNNGVVVVHVDAPLRDPSELAKPLQKLLEAPSKP